MAPMAKAKGVAAKAKAKAAFAGEAKAQSAGLSKVEELGHRAHLGPPSPRLWPREEGSAIQDPDGAARGSLLVEGDRCS